ncbi:glucosaminidase domain-containing protein [Butyricimonas virosa]|uniref:Glucosaminidase domain-containing protein n=1 Tax=Butyricimonas virosa TaxID=544645 RepID=A0ABX7H5Z3_9BACT|nr:glucosaminidase domain-containing protein [Butyricimonas virosa]QRO50306.1 glucosaminidase domain-containing protein [Butyricimonas virosa]UWO49004.1 glucosaminidase domain-containing protein [Butyricimonas virosa]
MSKNQQYAEQYADFAMQQMRKYGIPASVTLAQGILESSNGQSRLALNENNHFGIKATPKWIAEGGKYGLYTDDKPNEKFCSYDSVGDSYEHHSRFLVENKRYDRCFTLAPDDYKGWTEGLAKAGYASGSNYAGSLQKIIEVNGLQKYDRMVMAETKAQGLEIGQEKNVDKEAYSFPVKREEFLFVTSPFGMRTDPMDAGKQQMHKGIDIRCKGDAVLATENNGKVVAVNQNANTAGGKSVTIEYPRSDGSKVQNTYMHLSSVDVKVGDTVQAGQKVGVSGNTGTRTTGEHLHFGVTLVSADGQKRDMDPAVYLAEIAEKGNIRLQALHNGNDLLAKYKTEAMATPQESKAQSPEDWMKKLLSSEDSGVGLSGTNDPIMDMVVKAFSSLMMLAVVIDSKDEEEQISAVSKMADERKVDLTPLLPHMKTCALVVGENNKAVLQADNGSIQFSRELSANELSCLSATLNSPGLSEESKRMRVAGMVNALVLSQQASQNFEQGMSEQQGREEQIKR